MTRRITTLALVSLAAALCLVLAPNRTRNDTKEAP
jgi:hypothetical protein